METQPASATRDPAWHTIDELATLTQMTVRTTRYYASLGLLPPPMRQGRLAYYSQAHVARLDLIRALQDHGLTLAAIERYLADLPDDATRTEISVHRALLTAWRPDQWLKLNRSELEDLAGRNLSDDDLTWLRKVGAVRGDSLALLALPSLPLAIGLRDAGFPLDGIVEANQAVRDHMSQLADELGRILNDSVLAHTDLAALNDEEAERFERTIAGLRTLTLDAIVGSFSKAANQLAERSWRLTQR